MPGLLPYSTNSLLTPRAMPAESDAARPELVRLNLPLKLENASGQIMRLIPVFLSLQTPTPPFTHTALLRSR